MKGSDLPAFLNLDIRSQIGLYLKKKLNFEDAEVCDKRKLPSQNFVWAFHIF